MNKEASLLWTAMASFMFATKNKAEYRWQQASAAGTAVEMGLESGQQKPPQRWHKYMPSSSSQAPEREERGSNLGPPGSSKQGLVGTKQISIGPGPGDRRGMRWGEEASSLRSENQP